MDSSDCILVVRDSTYKVQTEVAYGMTTTTTAGYCDLAVCCCNTACEEVVKQAAEF